MSAEEKVDVTGESEERAQNVAAQTTQTETTADAATATKAADVEVAKAMEQLQAENEQLVSRLHRLQADFDNFRKRVANEKKDWQTQTICELVRELLPVIDNLERANEAAGSLESLKDGVELIHRQLLTVLGQQGFEKIEACGQEFDPNFHHAVMQVEGDEPENTVVEELQKGYLVNGRVVRPSMVKVVK